MVRSGDQTGMVWSGDQTGMVWSGDQTGMVWSGDQTGMVWSGDQTGMVRSDMNWSFGIHLIVWPSIMLNVYGLAPRQSRIVYTDAGYGGYTVEHGLHVAQGSWLPKEAAKSSTWRELVAVLRVLVSIAPKLQNM